MSNDEYYVNRCLDGHPDDFRHLVRRYQNVLMAHLVGQLGNMGEAEEVAQETLVRCYFGLSKLKKRGSFFPWLLGISNRVAKEQHRSRQRRRQTLSGLAEKKHQQSVKYDYPLARTIGQLPDFYRELILLRYYGDTVTAADVDKVLFRWKLDDGQYRVIYGDLRIEDVSAEKLAELEAE